MGGVSFQEWFLLQRKKRQNNNYQEMIVGGLFVEDLVRSFLTVGGPRGFSDSGKASDTPQERPNNANCTERGTGFSASA
jgi:hypothetical protein